MVRSLQTRTEVIRGNSIVLKARMMLQTSDLVTVFPRSFRLLTMTMTSAGTRTRSFTLGAIDSRGVVIVFVSFVSV